jgi:3-oxoacyl-[acyl-carrier protein] reductase
MQRQALITGASRGIGRATAVKLAAAGHRVLLNYRTRDDLAMEVAERIKEQGGQAELLPFDVAEYKQAATVVKQYIKTHGAIDIVVNNAGITKDQLFGAMKYEDWDRVIRVALDGFYSVTKPCIHGMLKQNWGRIVNVASMAALFGNAGQVNYSAAKAGLIGATRALSRELCKRGILVNAVAPGFIDTDILAALKVPHEDLEKLIPMGRLGLPAEVAKVIAFLVSEDTSYLTGQVIGVNGGML